MKAFFLITILLIMIFQGQAQNNSPEVTNVTFSQRSDGSFIVDVYYDFDEVEDVYVSLSLGYSRELVEKLSMDIGLSAGYAGEDASAGVDSGLHDYNASFGLGYAATDAISLSCFIAYTDSFDDDVLPEQDVDVYGGIGAYYAF